MSNYFQAAIQGQDLAGDFLSPLALVILQREDKIGFEQLEEREIRRRFAVGHRRGFENEAATLRGELKLIEEARLP